MFADVAREIPNSRLIATVAWTKSGEEVARSFACRSLEVELPVPARRTPASDAGVLERRLRQELRRAGRAIRGLLRAIEENHLRDEVLPADAVSALHLIVQIGDEISRHLDSVTLSSDVRGDLLELEDAIADLDDFVETQQLAVEASAAYADVAAKLKTLPHRSDDDAR